MSEAEAVEKIARVIGNATDIYVASKPYGLQSRADKSTAIARAVIASDPVRELIWALKREAYIRTSIQKWLSLHAAGELDDGRLLHFILGELTGSEVAEDDVRSDAALKAFSEEGQNG